MTAWGRQPVPDRASVFGLTLLLAAMMWLLPAWPAAAAEVELLTPSDGAAIFARHPETHLVLRQAPGTRMIRVQIGESTRLLDPVLSMEGEQHIYRHYRLPLKPGDNDFTLVPAGKRFTLSYHRIQSELQLKPRGVKVYAFHQGDQLPESCTGCHELDDSSLMSRVGLPKQDSCVSCHARLLERGSRNHSTTTNRQCLTCHQQSVDPLQIGLPSAPIRDVCLSCHTGKKDWFDMAVPHGPINLGGCTLCHDPHGENHRHQLWAEGSLDLCLACHSNMAQLVTSIREKKIPFVHNVLTGPGCVACHDPHASDQIFVLKKPINELCSGCHPGPALSGGHPVANHPVSGPKENLRPGRELSCTSCHEAHGSYNRYLLIETNLGGRLCRECHRR